MESLIDTSFVYLIVIFTNNNNNNAIFLLYALIVRTNQVLLIYAVSRWQPSDELMHIYKSHYRNCVLIISISNAIQLEEKKN